MRRSDALAVFGGYLSRVDDSSKAYYTGLPVMNALMELSEGRTLQPEEYRRALEAGDDFIRQTEVGYVVWRRDRASQELRDFASASLDLRKVAEVEGYDLLVPRSVHRAVDRASSDEPLSPATR